MGPRQSGNQIAPGKPFQPHAYYREEFICSARDATRSPPWAKQLPCQVCDEGGRHITCTKSTPEGVFPCNNPEF